MILYHVERGPASTAALSVVKMTITYSALHAQFTTQIYGLRYIDLADSSGTVLARNRRATIVIPQDSAERM